MGAAQSGAGGQGGSDSATAARDYYAVLGVEQTATGDEIRKAYRKLALRHHPDKNPDNVEEAQQQFLQVQAAYDVLNDDQERAWYDNHRDDIMNGTLDEDVDDATFDEYRSGKATPAAPSQTGPGLTVRHLVRFVAAASTLETTGPKSDESGFFGTYRRLFERLAEEEKAAMQAKDIDVDMDLFPSFGYSHTPYAVAKGAEATVHQVPVKEFYKVWSNFVSEKSFTWMDQYQTNQAPDRNVKRLMEKENKRIREQARKEYNETVRALVAHIRKRDPRLKAHQDVQSDVATAQRVRREAEAKEKAAEQKRAADAYIAQDWQRTETYNDSEFDSDEDDDPNAERHSAEGAESGEGADRDDQDKAEADETNDGVDEEDEGADGIELDEFECFACDKVFQTEGGLRNHEQSKKHKQKVEKLRREMLEEEELLDLGTQATPAATKALQDDDHEHDETSSAAPPDNTVEDDVDAAALGSDPEPALLGSSKKAKKAKKKNNKKKSKKNVNPGVPQDSDEEGEGGDLEDDSVLAEMMQRNMRLRKSPRNRGPEEEEEEEARPDAGTKVVKDSATLASEFVPPEGSFDVFGYGSLIFKPPPHVLHSIPGFVSGFSRRFAQSSNDHRGTPQRPGRVVTLVTASDWRKYSSAVSSSEGNGAQEEEEVPPEGDIVWGVSYTIDPAHAVEVREYLNHREKNGYSAQQVDVFALGADGQHVRVRQGCLLYVGLPDNEAFVGPEPMDRLAERIVSCSGPSGPNHEYVLKLAEAVRGLPDSRDTYLFLLEKKVLALLVRDGKMDAGQEVKGARKKVQADNRELADVMDESISSTGTSAKGKKKKKQLKVR
ncbi:unnamed protein product [Tilletia controversa]|nr:unnamed protein product [Tilletia controversa]CAD6942888.1 unnamed protein product [Tilletia controversa]CAD6977122.1 unnamed protein product [Tilletia controversa]CAD6979088.1 unnamed protein product [Tilletia controversa]